jgi:hypothetical protein
MEVLGDLELDDAQVEELALPAFLAGLSKGGDELQVRRGYHESRACALGPPDLPSVGMPSIRARPSDQSRPYGLTTEP